MANASTKEQKEYEVIHAIMTTKTKEEAAQLLGVSRQTIYNYLKDEAFLVKLQHAQEERNKQIEQTMSEAVPKAVECLIDILEDRGGIFSDITPKDKLDAARILLTSPATMIKAQ